MSRLENPDDPTDELPTEDLSLEEDGLSKGSKAEDADHSTRIRWARVTEIVDGALQRPDAKERRRFLKEACAGEAELLAEVEGLLRFEDAGVAWLPSASTASSISSRDSAQSASDQNKTKDEDGVTVGTEIGPYRIESWLGEGGMGRVALASESTLGRHVALKLIRQDKSSPELLLRFEQERRILAGLNHPNIAKVLGSGTHEGLPYFAMEYVAGQSLDRWCDEQRLTIDSRIRLMLQICGALDEAHLNLVVHRDLKPSNILVDVDGRPKVLDFGIAKRLIDGELGAEIGATTRGHHPLSLPYAAPEQIRNQPVTQATDVYSLGVLLYELLCGHTPFELDRDPFENMRRICEQEPTPPSRRATLNREVWRRGNPKTIAAQKLGEYRNTDPRVLKRRLSGDLDAIVLKALAKKPADRYRTVSDLSRDLVCYLEGKPVHARSGDVFYRSGRLLHRRWKEFVLLAAILVGVLGVYSGLEGRKERVESLNTMVEFVRNVASDAGKEDEERVRLGWTVSGKQLFEILEDSARKRLEDNPRGLSDALEAIGQEAQANGYYKEAGLMLRDTLGIRQRLFGNDHHKTSRALNNLGTLAHQAGHRKLAEIYYYESLAMKERLGQSSKKTAKVRSNLASLRMFRGAYSDAEPLFLGLLQELETSETRNIPELASAHRNLGLLYFLSGRLDESISHLQNALKLRAEEYGNGDPQTVSVLSVLGRVYQAQALLQESSTERLDLFEAAQKAFYETLDVRRKRFDPGHLHIASVQKDRASLYVDMGKSEDAYLDWKDAFDVFSKKRPAGWEMAHLCQIYIQAGWNKEEIRREWKDCRRADTWEALTRIRGEESYYARRAQEFLVQNNLTVISG